MIDQSINSNGCALHLHFARSGGCMNAIIMKTTGEIIFHPCDWTFRSGAVGTGAAEAVG